MSVTGSSSAVPPRSTRRSRPPRRRRRATSRLPGRSGVSMKASMSSPLGSSREAITSRSTRRCSGRAIAVGRRSTDFGSERGVEQPARPATIPEALVLERPRRSSCGIGVGCGEVGVGRPRGARHVVDLCGSNVRARRRGKRNTSDPPALVRGAPARRREPDVVAPSPRPRRARRPRAGSASRAPASDRRARGGTSRDQSRRGSRASGSRKVAGARDAALEQLEQPVELGGAASTRRAGPVASRSHATAASVRSPPGLARRRDPSRPRRPCSSSTTCALMPPNPKALTAGAPRSVAHRPRPLTARSGRSTSEARLARAPASRILAVQRRRERRRWWTASAALMSPAIPAAGIAWPIIDLTDPRSTARRARLPR